MFPYLLRLHLWGDFEGFPKFEIAIPSNTHISDLRRSWAGLRSMGQTLINIRRSQEQFLEQSGHEKCPNWTFVFFLYFFALNRVPPYIIFWVEINCIYFGKSVEISCITLGNQLKTVALPREISWNLGRFHHQNHDVCDRPGSHKNTWKVRAHPPKHPWKQTLCPPVWPVISLGDGTSKNDDGGSASWRASVDCLNSRRGGRCSVSRFRSAPCGETPHWSWGEIQ